MANDVAPGGQPDRYRVLALHLTKPSNSEANVLARLLDGLDERIAVDLIVNQDGDGDGASHFGDLAAHPNVNIHSMNLGLPVDSSAPASRFGRLGARSTHRVRRQRVVSLARRNRCDLVYTSQQRFDCQLGELVSRRLGIPHIVHLHYHPGPWLRRPAMRRLTTCEQVIAISKFIGREAIGIGCDPRRVCVIPNTIDVPPLVDRDRLPSQPIVIGQVGRFSPGKGFPETVEAFASVHARHPHTSLLLVGDGPERDAVDAAISAFDVSSSVRWVGWQEDVAAWVDRIDVFVHPSRREPFGLAVLEAMARAVPVVAYGDGGTVEVVDDGVTGLLVEPGDVDELADSIARLVADADLRAQLGGAARRRVREVFGPAGAREQFTETVVSVIDNARRGTTDQR